MITIADLIRATGKQPVEWQGNCHWAATEASKLIPGSRVVRGFWHGPMKGYWGDRSHFPFTGHSWVELTDGTVIDPTRWSFENVGAYVFVGKEEDHPGCDMFCGNTSEEDEECHCGHSLDQHRGGFLNGCKICIPWPYDEGGNRIREEMSKPCPSAKEPGTFDFSMLSIPACAHVRKLAGNVLKGQRHMDFGQMLWLANMPYNALEPFAQDIYRWIIGRKEGALIPIDNRTKAGL